MYNLIRYYNQNRKKIWGIVVIIASAIIMLQLINYLVGINQERRQEEMSATSNNSSVDFNTANTILSSTTSAVSGNEISSSTLSIASDIVKQFVDYCNEGDIEQAYNLLTDECKEEMYSSVQSFQENYYQYIFQNGTMSCTMENWTNNTYFVKFKKDLLSTGGKSEGEEFSDYITIVENDGVYKININSYIGRTVIDKTEEDEGISITIESKDTYMEYEIYNLKIKNNLDEDIILDTLEDTKSTYIEDSNGVGYVGFLNEISDNELYIKSKYEREISIKFSNNYSSTREISSLVFSNAEIQNSDEEKIEIRVDL